MGEKRRSALTNIGKVAARLRDLLYARRTRPALESGEEAILEGRVVLVAGVIGARVGPLILTNRRLIWYEKSVARPLRPIYGEVRLSDVEAVDKGTVFDVVFGGKRLRLQLRGGRCKTLAARDRLDEWVAAIRSAIAEQN
jgi:hypothetical protein